MRFTEERSGERQQRNKRTNHLPLFLSASICNNILFSSCYLISSICSVIISSYRDIRVSLSDNEPVVRNVSYVYYINKIFTSGPMGKLLDDQQK